MGVAEVTGSLICSDRKADLDKLRDRITVLLTMYLNVLSLRLKQLAKTLGVCK